MHEIILNPESIPEADPAAVRKIDPVELFEVPEEELVPEQEGDTMFDEVCEILAKQLHLEKKDIAMEARIKDDLGADSLDILQLLMTIEEEKGIVIPDEELVAFNTVGDVVSYLERQGGKDQDAFE